MKARLITLLLPLTVVIPDVADCFQLSIYSSTGWTNHHQFSNPFGIGLSISQPVRPQLSVVLDLSHRRFHNQYFGEKLSRNTATTVKREPVDNFSYSNSGFLWIKNDFFFFSKGLLAVAVGAGPMAIDGRIVGNDTGRVLKYKGLNKISGNIAVGIESLISEKRPTFWSCYLNYQFLSSSIRLTSLPDPFARSIRGLEIRLGLSHIF